MAKAQQTAAVALTREAVIDAAAALVAEQGYEALSMRTLGERCGVSAMTLYRHVTTKEDLLGALADRILGEIELPDPDQMPWQDVLLSLFGSMHRVLLAHPELAEIATRQHLNGVNSYAGAEVVLAALERAGITGATAASAFDALTLFTIGFTQRQTSAHSEETLAGRLAAVETLPPERFAKVRGAGETFLLRYTDSRFDKGLALLIGGLEAWMRGETSDRFDERRARRSGVRPPG
jgi:TetR/AcrR family tetracycline transcriptional repressor